MASPQNDEHSLEFLRHLAAGTSHDLNNLLLVVTGCAELALEDPSLSPYAQRLMHDILAASERAGALTRQFLVLGRPSAGPFSPIDVTALLRSSETLLRRLVGERIRLQLDAGAAPLWVLSDASQLEQVIVNLALNARDAMPTGGTLRIGAGPTEAARVRTTDAARAYPAGRALLTVADTGSGIDPAIRDRMYEPYATTKGDASHKGLGLAVVRAIVDQLGGSIEVTTAQGLGTTFAIDLPQAGRPGTPAVI